MGKSSFLMGHHWKVTIFNGKTLEKITISTFSRAMFNYGRGTFPDSKLQWPWLGNRFIGDTNPYIRPIYVRAMWNNASPQDMAWEMGQYLHFTILKFPLKTVLEWYGSISEISIKCSLKDHGSRSFTVTFLAYCGGSCGSSSKGTKPQQDAEKCCII